MNYAEILQDTIWGEMLVTLAVAMLPVLELRAAIPFGVGLGLELWQSVLVSVIGNLIPVPFIILFIRKIFTWMRVRFPGLNGIVGRLESKARLRGETVKKYRYLGLCIFVAIPLPGTGAWTGALIAALLNMSLRRSIPPIVLGVLIAAVLITALTYGFTAIF